MAPAFFSKDGGAYERAIKKSPEEKARLEAERNGEREAVALWSRAAAEVRKKAFEDDRFSAEVAPLPKVITPEFQYPGGDVHIRSIIEVRCARCHGKDGAQSAYPLETYEQIAKYLEVSATMTVKPGGDWVKVEEPIGLEKLTQSTHAHLLSFAMLFSLTGLVVAFSSYPMVVRCVLGPWVVLAVFADVSLWWLARLSSDWGPYFAMGVIGTGGAAGAGLAAQITLSLWNMYGMKGRMVLALIFILGAACGGLVFLNQIQPGLSKKHDALNAKTNTDNPVEDDKKPVDKKLQVAAIKETEHKDVPANAKLETAPAPKAIAVTAVAVLSPMEKVFRFPVKDGSGQVVPIAKIPFKGDQDGGMVRAFFDKDGGDFAKAVKKNDTETQDKLRLERTNEMAAFLAWTHLDDVERRKAYETDAFNLPGSLVGKPFTDDYLAAGTVKVKSLIGDRCVKCHTEGSDAEKYPLDNYEQILKELRPRQ
jgi:hypothetical protein